MKHLVTGSLLLALLLAAALGAIGLLERYTSQSVQELRLAVQAMEQDDYATAVQCTQRAFTLWQKHQGFLCSIVYHTEMDEINVHFAQLQGNAASSDRDALRATCAELITRIAHLPQMEKAAYFNIFTHNWKLHPT